MWWRRRRQPAETDEGLVLADLPADELAAVRTVVEALAGHDEAVLRSVGALDNGMDPYVWTRDYGTFGAVDLVVPPGDASTWSGWVVRSADRRGWAAVVVDMWTEQEGRSDLSLELELERRPDGPVRAAFHGLHVL